MRESDTHRFRPSAGGDKNADAEGKERTSSDKESLGVPVQGWNNSIPRTVELRTPKIRGAEGDIMQRRTRIGPRGHRSLDLTHSSSRVAAPTEFAGTRGFAILGNYDVVIGADFGDPSKASAGRFFDDLLLWNAERQLFCMADLDLWKEIL
ncbi:hypothetical protein LshimejAT787_0605980 [Lyophyllum shimeji]|uniref:Uncharacterized protein n=1 Tax=Lyophyllum shimeji TaxID=47721 RepID=A0A9P3PQB3_LYOSH|nr:hypothetical protein LshimejAT787_0605980 [Lyophyllum shimeji]